MTQEQEKKYLEYLKQHINNVEKAFKWLLDKGIINNEHYKVSGAIFLHDESKCSRQELEPYAEYFYGERTEQVKKNFNYAWLRHIHLNKHHWQHWVLINDDDGTVALEMPYEYVVEMICDWWSFSHKTGNLKGIFDWYESHKEKMILHENTRKLVEEILQKIKENL